MNFINLVKIVISDYAMIDLCHINCEDMFYTITKHYNNIS